MKSIYKGPLRGIKVSNLEISNGIIKAVQYNTPIVKKDILFYRSRLNSFVSLEVGTILPDKNEALDYIKRTAISNNIKEEPYPCCTFVNQNEIVFSHQITDKEFKILKKQFKQQRKMRAKKK